MTEPDVTLTDYGLALECAILAVFLALAPTDRKGLRIAGMCFFIFLGLSAGAGGTVHGFCDQMPPSACQFLWKLTLLLVGLAAFSTWTLGAGVLATSRRGRWLALAAIPQVTLYSALVVLVTQEFWIAFTIYLPAALLLLAGFCHAAWHDGRRSALVGASGSILSLTSSFLQFMRIGIDPVYFNHNALAHVVQAVALALLFLGIRSVTGPDFANPRVTQPAGLSPPRG